jgi:hypothetical protein
MQLFGGGFGSGLDMPAILAFVVFAVTYLLVPVIGYRFERPAGLTAALYLPIGYIGISLAQLLLEWKRVLDGTGGEPQIGVNDFVIHILFLFAALKITVLVLALFAYVVGLSSLRLRQPRPEAADEELRRLRDENARLRKAAETQQS